MPTQSESGYPRAVDISSTGQLDSPVIRTGASGGSGGGDMTVDVTSYIDSKIETVRAQNDTRFTEVLAELKAMPAKLTWATVITGAAVVGSLVAIMSFAGDRFDGGVAVSSVSVEQAIEAREIASDNAERIEGLSEQAAETDRKLNVIIELLSERIEQ